MTSYEQAFEQVDGNYASDINNENVIEWIRGSDIATVCFSQKRFASKVRKLAKAHPDKVTIVRENEDGSIIAHLPTKAIKLSIVERELTEEQKENLRNNMKKALDARKRGNI